MAKTSRKRATAATTEIKTLAAARKSTARAARRVKDAHPLVRWKHKQKLRAAAALTPLDRHGK
eukprot:10292793-Alexandrium_andersonii.AAC.1